MNHAKVGELAVSKLAYSIADVQEAASVSRTFVFQELKEGRLKAKKAGSRTLILHEDLLQWLSTMPDKNIEQVSEQSA